MESGMKLKEGTGVIVLTRRVSLSEDAFTRPTDFVPERCASSPPSTPRWRSHFAVERTLLYH